MSETLTWDTEELSGCIVGEDLGLLRNFVTRGQNLRVPGKPGTLPLAPIMDELDVTLTWSVTGRFDPDGLPHMDRETGVEANLEHYRELFTTGADADGFHDISLAYAGSTFAGSAQLREYAQARTGPETARILTRLVITTGELDLEGS